MVVPSSLPLFCAPVLFCFSMTTLIVPEYHYYFSLSDSSGVAIDMVRKTFEKILRIVRRSFFIVPKDIFLKTTWLLLQEFLFTFSNYQCSAFFVFLISGRLRQIREYWQCLTRRSAGVCLNTRVATRRTLKPCDSTSL
jgi:hypothetical protein